MPERNTTIDFLRGFSTLLIILIHVNAYFLHVPVANLLANYSQFAVQVFVFCSAVIYFERKKDAPFSFSYVWKRAKRLLIPYYIFLVFFFLFIIVIQQKSISLDNITKWVLLQGDRDLNWLVVLFLYFIILMPFIRLSQKISVLFWSVIFLSFFSSVLLLFIDIPVHFRLFMWLPWSVLLIYSLWYARTTKKQHFLLLTIALSGVTYVISKYALIIQNHTLTLTENKYPPNIFYLSYGLLWIALLILLYQKLHIDKLPIQRLFDFTSRYSYQIFFIHFLYLYLFLETNYRQFHWWGLFLIITCLSLGTMWLWNYFLSILKKAN